MKSHSYIPRNAKVLKRTIICDDTIALTLKLTDKKPLVHIPGQFVMLSLLGYGEIPIGITTAPTTKNNEIEVAIRAAGNVSRRLWDLKVGDELGVNGPFGNGFPIKEIAGKDLVLVAGGIGLAPLRSLILYLKANPKLVKSLTILAGAKCPTKLLYHNEQADWNRFAVAKASVDECDKSWKDSVGPITKLFEEVEIKPGTIIITCGPPAMMNAVAKRYAGKRVAEKDFYILLERRMKCGIGKCQHCTCGKEYVCIDGPVFSYDRLKYNQEAFV